MTKASTADAAHFRLIRASAGTGKTYQLSGHALRELLTGASPSEILATTFTRKAAGEILGRVLMRLAEAARDEPSCAILAEQLQLPHLTLEQLQDTLRSLTSRLHSLRFSTLDSFFQQLARSLTLEIGLPPGWTILDGHQTRELLELAIDRVLQDNDPSDLERLLHLIAKGQMRRGIGDALRNAIAQFHGLYQDAEEGAWERFPEVTLLTDESMRAHVDNLMAVDVSENKRLTKARQDDVDRFLAGQWMDFVTKGLVTKILTGDTYYNKPIPADLVSAYSPLIRQAAGHLILEMSSQTRATHDLLERFDNVFSALKMEHGGVEFNDITRLLARTSLAVDTDRLGFRLDGALRHLLLDEFQDTSPFQWKVLHSQTARILRLPDRRSFFCVGDVKQAIYGWRGGEAEILDAVEDAVPGIQRELLDESRRSSVAVIRIVNEAFQHLSNHDSLDDYADAVRQWSAAFPTHDTVRRDEPGYAVLRTSPDFRSAESEDAGSDYFRWAADQIQSIHQSRPSARVGVLTRRNDEVARLVYELRLRRVPASEVGGSAPTDSPAVLALLSLLQLVDHPGDTVARFHVVNSPLSDVIGPGRVDDDLAAAAVAARLRARLLDEGYASTLQDIVTQIEPCCDRRDRQRLQQVVATAVRYDAVATLRPAAFVRLLENERLPRSEPGRVQVMTVHQSKGLEFDIVVLPALGGDLLRPPNAAYSTANHGEPPNCVSVWRNRSLIPLLPDDIRKAFEQTTNRAVSESLCVLYVAMTRAADELHMFIEPSSSKNYRKSHAGLLQAALAGRVETEPDSILFETGVKTSGKPGAAETDSLAKLPLPRVTLAEMTDGRLRGLLRHKPSDHAADRFPRVGADRFNTDDVAVVETSMLSAETPIHAADRGTLIHAWLSTIEWLDEQTRPDLARLRDDGLKLGYSESLVNTLLPDFSAILQQPTLRSLLKRPTPDDWPEWSSNIVAGATNALRMHVENERPFVMRHHDSIVQGSIDRIELMYDDDLPVAAMVTDFKTDAIPDHLSEALLNEWLLAKSEYYAGQLDVYRRAVAHCYGLARERIRCRLMMLSADRVVDLMPK